MNRAPRFPFLPKSSTFVLPGMFWAIPLESYGFATGVVLGKPDANDPFAPRSNKIITVGLLDWRDSKPPTTDSLAGVPLLDWGLAHVRSIDLTSGGEGLLGQMDIAWVAIPKVSHRAGGTVGYYENGTLLRSATPFEARTLPVLGAWGLTFIASAANSRFGQEAEGPA